MYVCMFVCVGGGGCMYLCMYVCVLDFLYYFFIFYCISSDLSDLSDMADEYIDLSVHML